MRDALAIVALLAAAPSGPWLDVPFVRQSREGCGAASIAMVLGYWGRPADAGAILRELYSPEERGIRASDMQQYLERQGFRAFTFEGDWNSLAAHIAKGRPLIVALRDGRALHYVVVAGVADDYAFVNDPARRKLLRMSRRDFEKRWHERWTLLAVPADSP